MAIYRPPKPRWPAAVAAGVAGLLVGGLVGLAVGSTEPDPLEVARDVQSTLVAAASSLEVAEIEYDEAVANGEVEREAEYEGALDAMESSRGRYGSVRPALAVLAPSTVERVDGLYDRCRDLMEERSPSEQVAECLAELAEALEAGT